MANQSHCITSTPGEIRAAQDGSTQIWVPMEEQPSDFTDSVIGPSVKDGAYFDAYNGGPYWCWWTSDNRQGDDWIRCPYSVGDTLVFREACWVSRNTRVIYDADLSEVLHQRNYWNPARWQHRTAQQMPAWAARYRPKILSVEVKRVQDCGKLTDLHEAFEAALGFRDRVDLWNTRYPKQPWSENPWCWKLRHEEVS